MAAFSAQPRVKALMSDEHFSVDGTVIQAWASHNSFQLKPATDDDEPRAPGASVAGGEQRPGRHGERDWRGRKRSNQTHASTTDPDARLARKSDGQSSIMAYAGHVLLENRNRLVSGVCLNRAGGTAERDAALTRLYRRSRHSRITMGADKGYDVRDVIAELRARSVTPHIAIDTWTSKPGVRRRSAVDGRTTHHAGYAVSLRVRKRIDEVFGWVKSSAGLRQTKFRGVERVGWSFSLAATAYNLIRLPRLLASPA